jgi:hypothetical protein
MKSKLTRPFSKNFVTFLHEVTKKLLELIQIFLYMKLIHTLTLKSFEKDFSLFILLATEVTPGLQQEQSPTPISLCHDLFIKGVIEWKLTQNNIVLTPKLGQVCMGK